MKDEIKEINLIIRHFIDVKEGRAFTNLTFKQTMILLDYITNLQTIEQQYSAILSENAELENKITNLQEDYEKEHYLVDKLTRQLNDEYKNTEYQCKEKERLNNIIKELEKLIKLRYKKCEEFIETMDNKTYTNQVWDVATTVNADRKEVLDKLKELKEE